LGHCLIMNCDIVIETQADSSFIPVSNLQGNNKSLLFIPAGAKNPVPSKQQICQMISETLYVSRSLGIFRINSRI
jgi:hypothetical protein